MKILLKYGKKGGVLFSHNFREYSIIFKSAKKILNYLKIINDFSVQKQLQYKLEFCNIFFFQFHDIEKRGRRGVVQLKYESQFVKLFIVNPEWCK